MGLTCAARLLDLDCSVDIFSRDDLWKTTSTSAGAYWWPHKTYPEEKVSRWSKETYDEYSKLKSNSQTGVSFQKHFRFCLDPDENTYALHLVQEWKEINGADYGIPCQKAYLVVVPVIDVPIFMPYLRDLVQSKGAQIHIREFNSPAELFPDLDLVVNCSGVWARHLVNDKEVFPIRGQVVRISKLAKIKQSTRIYRKQDQFTLVLPRINDCILGGTAQEGDWSLEISENDTREIIERCSKIVPAVTNCQILGAAVGLRPGRSAVRLELEQIGPNRPIVHNYGHGGGGFTVAWGCASEVANLVREYFSY